jgi:hypothetical protein
MIYKDLVLDHDAPATALNILLLKLYGAACYGWEPETLWLELMDDLYIDHIPDDIKDKISAIITLNVSDQFYDRWEVFENIGQALNDMDVYTEDMTPLDPEHLTWTIMEAMLNDETSKSFSPDVGGYISTVFKSNGVSTPPKFISRFINYKTYNKYDKTIEGVYQKRIEAYCLKKVEYLVKACIKYFNKDIRQDVKREFPEVSGYIT